MVSATSSKSSAEAARRGNPRVDRGAKMRLQVSRYSLEIIPESPQDVAFLEEVIGLKSDGDWADAYRVNAMALSSLAYLRIEKIKSGNERSNR